MDLVMGRYMERPYMNDETIKYLGGRSLMMGTLHGFGYATLHGFGYGTLHGTSLHE
jgi:hypothetical protein